MLRFLVSLLVLSSISVAVPVEQAPKQDAPPAAVSAPQEAVVVEDKQATAAVSLINANVPTTEVNVTTTKVVNVTTTQVINVTTTQEINVTTTLARFGSLNNFGDAEPVQVIPTAGVENPLLFFGALSYNGKHEGVVRTASQPNNSSTAMIYESTCRDGIHYKEEVLDYMILSNTNAAIALGNGQSGVVFTKDVTYSATEFTTVDYPSFASFSATPHCFVHIQTNNNPGFIKTRMQNIGQTSLQVKLDIDESGNYAKGVAGAPTAAETVGFFCVPGGAYETNILGHVIKVGSMDTKAGNRKANTFSYKNSASHSQAILATQTYNGADPMQLRVSKVDTKKQTITFIVQEDVCKDGHTHVSETVSYLVF